MRRILITGVVLASVLIVLGLPPATVQVTPLSPAASAAPTARAVLGAYHVHSKESDGSGDRASIAAAAARAGLAFVILTDHGTGTRTPQRPEYIHGVLCIDAVEISTTGGHYVALGLPRTPFPLRGEPEDVVEDVARFGGFGIAAHPDSPKPALAWQAWDTPVNGIEWLNMDSEWRDESGLTLLRGLTGFWLRPGPVLASLIDRPKTLERWDALTKTRAIVALTAVDAHARLGLGNAPDPIPDDTLGVAFPSYESSFRSVAMGAELDRPLTQDAEADAAALLDAITHGRVFGVATGVARPGRVAFEGRQGSSRVTMGTETDLSRGPIRIRADVDVPAGAELRLIEGGNLLQRGTDSVQLEARSPGVYRAEVWVPGFGAPWVVTNPIYVRERSGTAEASTSPPALAVTDVSAAPNTERDQVSQASVTGGPADWRFSFSLAPEGPVAPWAAAVWPLPDEAAAHDGVRVTLSSDRAIRVSWQLRTPGATDDRWRRSVFVDSTPRSYDLGFETFKRVRADLPLRAPLPAGSALLLVVDFVNNDPGTAGTVTVRLDGLTRKAP